MSVPPTEVLPFEIEDDEFDTFELINPACHRLVGFPYPIQGCDELCENGRRLLLQIDSDDAYGWMWGDAGMIYVVSRNPDFRLDEPDSFDVRLQCC